jgi:hypothetical protein
MKSRSRLWLAAVVIALFAMTPADKGVIGSPPQLTVTGDPARAAAWTAGFNAVWPELLENLKMPKPPFATRYVQPGPSWPDDVYLWDTAFIAEVWRIWDVQTGQDICRAVLDSADRGRLQHAVGRDEHTKDTQPPVMEWAIWRLYQQSHDRAFLAYAYPILRDYNRWLYDNRRHPSGLFFWVHPYESGMDNAPRFSNRNVSKIAEMKNLAAIDMSSYIVLQNLTLAKMADELGLPAEAGDYRARAAELKTLINEKLWDPASGLYYDRDMNTDRLIKIKSIASLIPLFCGVPDAAQARQLRDHIMNPAEFNTPFPLPSIARDDPAFEKDMWRGPVWINTAYMIILGLEDYGFKDDASDLAFRVVDGVYRHHAAYGTFFEYYDPDHDGFADLGRKTSLIRRMNHNDQPKPHFVGWTGLVNNLVVEHLAPHPPADMVFDLSPGGGKGQ